MTTVSVWLPEHTKPGVVGSLDELAMDPLVWCVASDARLSVEVEDDEVHGVPETCPHCQVRFLPLDVSAMMETAWQQAKHAEDAERESVKLEWKITQSGYTREYRTAS